MSVPVAIPAAVTAGQTPAGNAWAQANTTQATGFEALLAALFPTAPAGLAGPTGQAKGGLGLVKDPTAQAATEPESDETADPAASAVQAQLAALLAVQPAQVQPTSTVPVGTTDTLKSSPPAPVLPAAAPVTTTPAQTLAKAEILTPTAVPPETPQAAAPQTAPVAPQTPATPTVPTAPAELLAPAAPAPGQPLVQPAAEPKAPPPALVAAAVLPLAEAVAEPPAEAPAEPPPTVATAVAASAEAKPAVKTEKPEAPAPVRAAAPSATPEPTTLAQTATAAQPAQPSADSGHDQAPPDQRETARSDNGAPDQVAAPTTGPASAAHMIQAEAAATAARGAPETVAKLAAQIVRKLDGKTSRFDIALDPAGLGKVDVKVEINAQGQMTAALNFDTAAAAAELRGRASELRAALEQAGFDMSQSNLSFSFAGQQDNSGQAFAQRDGRQGGARFLQALADDQPVAAPAASSSILGSRSSGVDVRI